MKTILWITDGKKWGWDNKYWRLSKLLPQFRHFRIDRHLVHRTKMRQYVKWLKPDIIVCFPTHFIHTLEGVKNVIAYIPGIRHLELSEALLKDE
jgi:hypothetical protein